MRRPPAPPVALYVHVPFCVSLCPYCDFVVYRRRGRARAANAGSRRSSRRSRPSSSLRGGRARRARSAGPGRRPAAARDALPRRRHAVAAAARGVARLLDAGPASASAWRADAEVTLEANPGPDERGDAAAWRAAGVTRLSFGAQSMSTTASSGGSAAGTDAADVADAVAAARAAGIGSVSLDLLYDVPGQHGGAWIATLDAALALEPDHLSLYALTLDDPDAEGLTGPDGDHLPDDRRRPPLARPRPARPGRGPRGGPVPPRGRSPGGRRLARLRDQQLGAARPREPAQPRLLGAPALRGGRPRRARLRRRRPAAGTRPGSTATSPRSPRPTAAPPRLPPGGAEAIDADDRRRRSGHPRAPDWTAASRWRRAHEPPLADASAGPRRRSCST